MIDHSVFLYLQKKKGTKLYGILANMDPFLLARRPEELVSKVIWSQ